MIINKMDELCSKHKSHSTKRMKKLMQIQAESMLGQMKVCTDPDKKRELVKSYNPNHYIFGFKLDPRNPYEQGESNE